MRMEVSLQVRLEQKLRLAPQIIQSIEILQLAALELQDLVKQELEENPTLEEDLGTVQPEPERQESQESGDLERELEGLERVDAVWNDYFSRTGSSRSGAADGGDRKREAMENTAAPSVSLQEYLVQQLHLLNISTVLGEEFLSSMEEHGPTVEELCSHVRAIAEYLIYNLDDNGYLPYSLEEIIESYSPDDGPREGWTPLERRAAPETPDSTPATPGGNGEGTDGRPEGARGKISTHADETEVRGGPGPSGDGGNGPSVVSVPPAHFLTATAPDPGTGLELPRGEDPISKEGNGEEVAPASPGEAAAVLPVEEDRKGPTELLAEEALRVVQTLDPPGVGGRSLKEVLLLQLGRETDTFQEERKIIQDHLKDIQSNRFPKIAKALGTDIEDVKDRIAFIRMLNPRPGSLFAPKSAHYIIPDVVVQEVAGDYEVQLEDTYIPRLHISPHYRRMLTEQRENPKVREFIKKKIESAKWLIESIQQRQNTLLKISREIVSVQRGFLDYGVEKLRPLKMQHIADRVGVHVSTVSRALADKYVQTPRGIYPMKFFFTGGTVSRDGTVQSTVSIKQKVRDIIEKEDRKHPLSDEDIALKLREDHGLEIARRTITKYRKQLSIPSSRQRRTY